MVEQEARQIRRGTPSKWTCTDCKETFPRPHVHGSVPIHFHRKELRRGSGGGGAQPGGLGQTVEFSVDTTLNWELNAVTSRLSEPPQGIFGGRPGAPGSFSVNGEPVTTQSRITPGPDDLVRLELPGGGGFGAA